jgi:DNA-binding beta-propeller fold protein YncE
VSVDQAGNILVADQANNRVRRIDATTAIITTFAGGGTTFNSPSGVAARPGGAVVIDTQGQKVRAILPVIE